MSDENKMTLDYKPHIELEKNYYSDITIKEDITYEHVVDTYNPIIDIQDNITTIEEAKQEILKKNFGRGLF